MDTITHSLIGALTVRAGAPEQPGKPRPSRRQLLIAAALAAAFPDIDYATMLIDPLSFIADWHRGPTHSIVMIPLWALLLGWLSCRLTKHKEHLLIYTLVASVALLSHILSDIITAWGTQILWPLSDYRAALGISFVIDPILSAIVFAGLVASLYWNRKAYAISALIVLISYIGMQGIIKTRVEAIGDSYVAKQNLQGAGVTALPQPLAPFNWTLIITDNNTYHVARTNILLSEPLHVTEQFPGLIAALLSSYLPTNQLRWERHYQFGNSPDEVRIAKAAWQRDEFARFRRFARLPKLYRLQNDQHASCAWFADLRYLLPSLEPPFKYGMCKTGSGEWLLYRP